MTMNAPDWAALERARDAERYSGMCEAAERDDREAEEADRQMNIALTAIRNMHINMSNVRQLLSTIAAAGKEQGWTDAQVWPLDIAQTELDE